MFEEISIKKIKKDGSIDTPSLNRIAELLKSNRVIVIPVDGIYGILGMDSNSYFSKVKKIPVDIDKTIHLVSNYSMLEKLTLVNKKQYDFLHRIWPDEVDVVLHSKNKSRGEYIHIRYPRYKFLHDLLDKLGEPLVFKESKTAMGDHFIKKDDIKEAFKDSVDGVVIIEEWCKVHPDSTIIDLRDDDLKFLRKGRVSIEEIKSLYFLDTVEEY